MRSGQSVLAVGCRNSEVQFAGSYSETGTKWTLIVEEENYQSLSRQLVKSDTAVLTIPELEFEIPANTQKGQLSTIEGFLRYAVFHTPTVETAASMLPYSQRTNLHSSRP